MAPKVTSAAARREHILRRQIDCAAAFLVLAGIVADQAEREIAVRLEQDLSPGHPAVAVIEVAAGNDVLEEAVALDPYRVETCGDRCR